MLVDMRPLLAAHDTGNVGTPSVVLGPQLSCRDAARCISAAYVLHLLFCQFGASVPLAARSAVGLCMRPVPGPTCGAPFGNSILRVLLMRSCPEVLRIAAAAIVAGVANKQARWNRTVRQHISNSMSEVGPTLKAKLPVPVEIGRSIPKPADTWATRLIDAAPKAFFGGRSTAVEVEGKLYNIHVNASNKVLTTPRLFVAARGFTMPNYSTFVQREQ